MRGGLDRQIQTTEGPGTKRFRREEGINGEDPQTGDQKKIKGPGGQDRPEGGPDGQG